MGLLNSSDPTLLDLANLPANGEAKEIINMLGRHNPMLMDAPAFECNKGSSHETTILTGLPSTLWGRIYKGVPSTKSTRQLIKDTTGFLESAAQVDTRMVDVMETAEGKASIRMEEADGHLEAMAQEAATALFYHDTAVDPDKPLGFAPRFNSLGAENGGQIIDGGGLGVDNTSMWMISWDKKASHLIYPKGYKAGIDRKDRGVIPATDANGDTFMVYREEFTWHLGLSVRDWRYVSRGANIDVSDLTVDASAGANILNVLTDMYYKHNGRRALLGKTILYVNTTIMKFLDHQARNVPSNLQLRYSETGVNAEEVLQFRGMTIRESDALLDSEARIV